MTAPEPPAGGYTIGDTVVIMLAVLGIVAVLAGLATGHPTTVAYGAAAIATTVAIILIAGRRRR